MHGGRPLNRLQPAMQAANYKTYEIDVPDYNMRPATCAEVKCRAYLNGWSTVIDETTDLGRGQAYYLRKNSGRMFAEESWGPQHTVFKFTPGQTCFAASQHRVPRVDVPEIYVVRDGDWRGNPRGTPARRHVRGSDWVDDFANHQNNLAARLKRG